MGWFDSFPIGSYQTCTYCALDYKVNGSAFHNLGFCSIQCQEASEAFKKIKIQEEIKMGKQAKKTQVVTEAEEVKTVAETPETPKVKEKKEKGPAKMAHGEVQDKAHPPTEELPEGWQHVWHDPYTYDGKNGKVTVRGHWEKAKKSPSQLKVEAKVETAPEATDTTPKAKK